MDARSVPFFIVCLLYLAPLVLETISGAQRTRRGDPARWEGALNLVILPVVLVAAAVAQPALPWLPPWYVVFLLAILIDVVGFLAWWAVCAAASPNERRS